MSEKIQVGLSYIPENVEKQAFDDEYTITVARSDGKGLTHIEAETVLSVYLMAVKTGAKQTSTPRRKRG